MKAGQLLIVGGVVAFLIFFVVTSPDDAAKITHALWHGLVHTAHGVVNFVNKL